MDDLIDIGITIILRRLRDKKRFEPYLSALRKVVRNFQLAYPQDEIWQEVCERNEVKK